MGTYTTNLTLYKPAVGETGWGTLVDANCDTLDGLFTKGTFTPSVTFVTPGNLSVAYSTQIGRYYKVGQLVNAWGTVATSSFTHTTASGNFTLLGLPFVQETGLVAVYCGVLAMKGWTKASYTQVVLQGSPSLNTFVVAATGSGQALVFLSPTEVLTGGTVQLDFHVSYVSTV